MRLMEEMMMVLADLWNERIWIIVKVCYTFQQWTLPVD